MKINDYLKKNKLSQESFAKQLGVSQGLVWQWLNNRTKVSAAKAKQIEISTNGAITRKELRPELFA